MFRTVWVIAAKDFMIMSKWNKWKYFFYDWLVLLRKLDYIKNDKLLLYLLNSSQCADLNKDLNL